MTKLSSHIKLLCKVPDDIFLAAKNEVLLIDWNNLPVPDMRSSRGVFKATKSNHLRVHNTKPDTPDTYEARADIIDCVDTKARSLYPHIKTLTDWVFREVGGKQLGRVMIVNLAPGGEVVSHRDLGAYFSFYYRFHLPFMTASEVAFTGPPQSEGLHMEEQYLYQLQNQNLHGVYNRSECNRIHLILDIASSRTDLNYERLVIPEI